MPIFAVRRMPIFRVKKILAIGINRQNRIFTPHGSSTIVVGYREYRLSPSPFSDYFLYFEHLALSPRHRFFASERVSVPVSANQNILVFLSFKTCCDFSK